MFVIAATGNYANYVSYKKKHSGSSSTLTVWYSNVDKVRQLMLQLTSLVSHSNRLFDLLQKTILKLECQTACSDICASATC